jgi:DNA mismatch repair protein MutS2
VDELSLRHLEFDRVTAAVATRAACAAARLRLATWRPIAAAEARAAEVERLAEALRRQAEPGEWCWTAEGEPARRLDPRHPELLDGPGLVEVLGWLGAGRSTSVEWAGEAVATRYPRLAECARALPDLEPLRATLTRSLEPDGRIADAASPALARARRELAQGERTLQQRLEKWARAFGDSTFVTRHADRFVALVPAAGFPRRRALVHDVSGSGQSLFVEPLEMCESNNRLMELRSVVTDEERRILRELADSVRGSGDAILALEETIAHLDTLRARARWGIEFAGIALTPGGERIRLLAARHPLLAMSERGGSVVPLDLELTAPGRLLLVSGPNMGGKTVLLKTVGLAVALSHAAFPVPAGEGSAVPVIGTLVVDLGDQQSVDQGLSTFAAHLRSLAEMAEHAGPESLLLCDELGAGTDPEEGASLGRALIEHFAARGAWGVLTTHLGSLKRVAGEVTGVVNGSLDFDVTTMTPLYRFLPGVPGASHALSVAERLGFPAAVVARARELAPAESGALERLLGEVQVASRKLQAERGALAEARVMAEEAAAASRAATEASRQTMAELQRRLTIESEGVLARARELWQSVQREARKAEKSRTGADRVRADLSAVEHEVEALQREARTALGPANDASVEAAEPLTVAAGQRVRVRDLGVEADVVAGPDAEGKVMLRRGNWNIHSHVSRLEPASEPAGSTGRPVRSSGVAWTVPDEAPAIEADLRGMEVDEALQALDRALDRAVLTGFAEIRIIHGVGKGVLRAVVERHLRGHPQVASQRLGGVGEGGRGVTVATLR